MKDDEYAILLLQAADRHSYADRQARAALGPAGRLARHSRGKPFA